MSDQIVERLYAQGVRELISCPGGRSAALLNSFVEHGKFKITSVYDERTAGFFALGRSIESKTPVVVLTTSGSAVAGLYPAVLEARYQVDCSLILLTADRPEEFRNTGAPQTINQIDFFKTNGVSSVEVKDSEDINLNKQVVHLNVCLEDPNPIVQEVSDFKTIGADANNFQFEELLVIASLKNYEKKEVIEQLKGYKGFLIVEALSNIDVEDFPNATLIRYPDLFFSQIPVSSFKSMCRIGGVPVGKFWKSADLMESFYWEAYPFPGAVRCKPLQLESLSERLLMVSTIDENIKDRLEIYESMIEEILREQSESEIGILKKLSDAIPEGSRIFLGNSLPIREWEHCSPGRFENIGQRGVNGIDGSLAYFLGQLSSEKENWIILGDITTLYNFNDFQIIKNLDHHKIRVVVVNNFGGQIFSRIFKKNTEFFVNAQNLSFEKIADLWSLGYVDESLNGLSEVQLPLKAMIEIKPDNISSNALWEEWKAVQF
jgi:2-succinyl-5-enolpyruvyl-6-hydroxy-3-cyclohexene-1-carboxylate synthase